jgi:hypothetical protein
MARCVIDAERVDLIKARWPLWFINWSFQKGR